VARASAATAAMNTIGDIDRLNPRNRSIKLAPGPGRSATVDVDLFGREMNTRECNGARPL
jgi:hypothetical protein